MKKQEAEPDGQELYKCPGPPRDGRVIALDVHPDLITACVLQGQTPHDAKRLETKKDLDLESFRIWVSEHSTSSDLFVMEAGANSFELHAQLLHAGRQAVVLHSTYVGRHACSYSDNDAIAAERIGRVFLMGTCPCVWVADAMTRDRRALLHYYQMTVARTTEATNHLKGYLNQYTIRSKKRSLKKEETAAWILKQREWSPTQELLLKELFAEVAHTAEKRQQAYRMICMEVSGDDTMLALMNLLGIGIINAFALVAIIGDIRRFSDSKKLVAYLGLNPGQRESGTHKRVKVGVGRHGRRDIRALLTQAAQSLLISSRDCSLAKWGWKLFARKGHRNIAISAVARKLAVQAWHLLKGNAPTLIEANKKRTLKLSKLATKIGKEGRKKLKLPGTIALCVEHYDERLKKLQQHQLSP